MSTINWDELDNNKYHDENTLVSDLPLKSKLDKKAQQTISTNAINLVKYARKHSSKLGLMESFLEEFGLSNKEGLALMCLAESLLRVPDAETADKLIAEKISSGDWQAHFGQSDNLLVNASVWGLMLTGKIIAPPKNLNKNFGNIINGLLKSSSEPIVRKAMMQAMKIMGEQFVLGRTIEEAISKAKKKKQVCSFDMLGEGAKTSLDAQIYFDRYMDAIKKLGGDNQNDKKSKNNAGNAGNDDGNHQNNPFKNHGISVKISALHPRYETFKYQRLLKELYPRLKELALCASRLNVNLCIDAEEADRLVLSLKLFAKLACEKDLQGWDGLGLAVQSYQKRASLVIANLQKLSQETNMKFMVRLVKGAYWDSEIKHCQVMGMPDFSVWTKKSTTDLAYLANARQLFSAKGLFPQFATHNAWSLAAVYHMAQELNEPFECQRLHGMGEPLYNAANNSYKTNFSSLPLCRIYAPVGSHENLLPYLVRRLLENGANTSFVHSFLDEDISVEKVATSPFVTAGIIPKRHAMILPPPLLFKDRKNSKGFDITMNTNIDKIVEVTRGFKPIDASSIVSGITQSQNGRDCFSPCDQGEIIGSIIEASKQEISDAFTSAENMFEKWDGYGGKKRAAILDSMADKLESKTEYFCAIMVKEAGKIYADAISEVREAVDFLRYYAQEARKLFASKKGKSLPGPVGESNYHKLKGRGVFVCISPWNFPLAIFTGQLAAALAAGNCVIAKPAEQTPLCAFAAVKLFHLAGLPHDALQLIIGGKNIGATLIEHPLTAGVAFTGSTKVGKKINQTLANKKGAIVPLIAETGGLNAMFIDTTALREQVIEDVIQSAFNAAGQRCSALRILFLPHDIADDLSKDLINAMDELEIGNPIHPATDIGPVIDDVAKNTLNTHLDDMQNNGIKILKQINVPKNGSYFSPTIIELNDLSLIHQESFGPILHIIRYKPKTLGKLCDELKAKGFGLTLGIHSRLESFHKKIIKAIPAGNVYINRNMIGAVVGVQPFGGEGLSGTGPKAGGPFYLARFASEQSISINITAQGGDPELLNLSETNNET